MTRDTLTRKPNAQTDKEFGRSREGESEIIPIDDFIEAPFHLPIDGTLDLHTFSPKDTENLLDDYIDACLEASILDIRVIHGKGSGAMRDRVYRFLVRHPAVVSFKRAPEEAGGWGAVLVRLRKCR